MVQIRLEYIITKFLKVPKTSSLEGEIYKQIS